MKTRKGHVTYIIETNNKKNKFHTNMLKQNFYLSDKIGGNQVIKCTEEGSEIHDEGKIMPLVPLIQIETIQDVTVCNNLPEENKNELLEILDEYVDMLTDLHGRTDFVKCYLNVKDKT